MLRTVPGTFYYIRQKKVSAVPTDRKELLRIISELQGLFSDMLLSVYPESRRREFAEKFKQIIEKK